MLHNKMFKASILVMLLSVTAYCLVDKGPSGKAAKLAVFTDYEADDAVAIALLMKFAKENNVHEDAILFGALLSNQYRKKALVQEMVKLYGYEAINVFAGTGGIKETFEEEGRNLLPDKILENLKDIDKKYQETNNALNEDPELNSQFEIMVQEAGINTIDVLLLTNPIDFVQVFKNNKNCFNKINKIYMMGGWFDDKPTFNWNLYLDSVKQLLELLKDAKGKPHSPQLIIFSSHFFAREFNGYVNEDKFPKVIEAFDRNSNPVVSHLRHMVKNWDDSMTLLKDHHTDKEKAWRIAMIKRIGPKNIGRQFAPADPATTLGYLYPEQFILKQTPTNINFSVSTDAQGKKNITVEHTLDPMSNVHVVEKVNLDFFNDMLVDLMSMPSHNA